MTAVAVALLTRPPEPESVQQAATPTGLAPDAVEFVAGTDNLLTMCSCNARSTVEQRIAWDDLPESLKQAIEARTGPIADVRLATAGQNSPLAVIVDTSVGKVFVKGMPSGHRRVITQAGPRTTCWCRPAAPG